MLIQLNYKRIQDVTVQRLFIMSRHVNFSGSFSSHDAAFLWNACREFLARVDNRTRIYIISEPIPIHLAVSWYIISEHAAPMRFRISSWFCSLGRHGNEAHLYSPWRARMREVGKFTLLAYYIYHVTSAGGTTRQMHVYFNRHISTLCACQPRLPYVDALNQASVGSESWVRYQIARWESLQYDVPTSMVERLCNWSSSNNNWSLCHVS